MIIPLIANASITRETLSIVIHTVVELQYFTFTLFLFKRCNVFKSEFYGTKCSCLMGSCRALFSFRHILNQLKKSKCIIYNFYLKSIWSETAKCNIDVTTNKLKHFILDFRAAVSEADGFTRTSVFGGDFYCSPSSSEEVLHVYCSW